MPAEWLRDMLANTAHLSVHCRTGRGLDHHVTGAPVGWACHLVLVGELQAAHNALDLVKVATNVQRIVDGGTELVLWVNEEHAAHCSGVVGNLLDHAVQAGHLLIQVRNGGEGNLRSG